MKLLYLAYNTGNVDSIFKVVIITGILQGFIFGAVVSFSKKYKSAQARYLAALIVVFSLSNLQYLLEDSGVITAEDFFAIYFVPYQLLASPLLLFYGLKMLAPEKKISFKNLSALIPFLIAFLLTVIYKILFALEYEPEAVDHFFDPFEALIEFSAIVLYQSVLVYLLLKVTQAEEQQRHFTPGAKNQSLTWFSKILTTFLVVSFMWLCVAVLSYVYDFQNLYYIIWLVLSVMIYWLGYIGIYRYGIQEERVKMRNYSIERKLDYVPEKNRSEHIASIEKLLVGERWFLDQTVTLDRIAEEIRISKSHLSRIINNEMGISFSDYINSLRIEEAKSYLKNPEFSNYTLVAIGLESGFNSKSAFNSAFKKITGLTPSEYKSSGLDPIETP